MRPFRILVLAVAALLAPAAGAFAACPDVTPSYTSACGPLVALPQWSDSGGWADESAWSTIRLGDVDGRPGQELLGRDAFGLWVHRFDPATGQWGLEGDGSPAVLAADANGWDAERYYATIRTGDVDGDGMAEIVVRGADGIEVYRRQAGGAFVRIDSGGGPFSDASGWTRPEYYETIQLADVDLTHRGEELLGRAGGGMLTYAWDPASRQFTPVGGVLGELSDPGMATPGTYSTIQTADVDGNGDAELIARETGGVRTFDWGPSGWSPAGPVVPLSDALGWGNEWYYRTIRTADLDGDGRAELIARSGAGLQAWSWTIGSGWAPLAGGAALADLSDDAGFTLPQHYATIVTGNVDGVKGEEVVARTRSGVRVWSWAGSGWTGRDAAPLPLVGEVWREAQHYGTFRVADVDGDGTEEVIVRGVFGVRTFRFAGGQFTRPSAYGRFPPFTGAEAGAYQVAGAVLLGPGGDARSVLSDPTVTSAALGGHIRTLAGYCTEVGVQPGDGPRPPLYANCALPQNVAIPPGVGATEWTTVVNELTAEFWAAQGVVDHFGVLSTTLGRLFIDQIGERDAIRAALQLPAKPPDMTPKWLKLFSSISVFIADLAGPFAKDGTKLLKAVKASVGLAHAVGAIVDGLGLEGAPPDPPAAWEQIAAQTVTKQQQQQDVVTAQRRYVMADYGLLTALGRMVQGDQLRIDDEAMVSAGRRAYAEWVYKMYLPAYWSVYRIDNCVHYWQGGLFCDIPSGPNVESWGNGFSAVLPNTSYCANHYIWVSCGFAAPPAVLANALWGPVAPSCVYDPTPGSTAAWTYGCAIGATTDDMINGRDGWGLPVTHCTVESLVSGSICSTITPWSPVTAGIASLTPAGGGALTLQAAHNLGPAAVRATSVEVESVAVEEPDGAPRELAVHLTGRRHDGLRLTRSGATPVAALHRGRALTERGTLSIGARRLTLRLRGVRVRTPEACAMGVRRVTLETRLRLHHPGERGGRGAPLRLRGSFACRRGTDREHLGLIIPRGG